MVGSDRVRGGPRVVKVSVYTQAVMANFAANLART
jgi:hypothetical protein